MAAETTSSATTTTNGECYENLGIYSVEIINVFCDNIELIIRCSRFLESLRVVVAQCLSVCPRNKFSISFDFTLEETPLNEVSLRVVVVVFSSFV